MFFAREKLTDASPEQKYGYSMPGIFRQHALNIRPFACLETSDDAFPKAWHGPG
jgi:hypothetical protein